MTTYQGADPTLVALAQVTIGPVLIGAILNVLLFGTSLTHFSLYWNMYRNDKPWIRLTMTLLLVLDVFNSVGIIVVIYRMFITHYGSEESVRIAPWLIATTNCIVASLIALIVQTFYAWRVYKLTGRRFIPICLVFLSVIANLSGTAVGISIIGWIHLYIRFQRFRIPGIMWLVSSVLCDCGITTSMVWYLKVHKTGKKDTDNILDNIIWLTVQTGMITSIAAIMDLILYLSFAGGYHMIFNQTLPGLYVISLLSSLNARARWKFDSDSTMRGTRSRSFATTLEFRQDCVTDCEVADGPTEVLVMHPRPQVVTVPMGKTGPRESGADVDGQESYLTPERRKWQQASA